MTDTTKPTKKLADIVGKAQNAFWAEVVRHMPMATSGDFAPLDARDLDIALEDAVTHWWEWNASEHYNLLDTTGVLIWYDRVLDDDGDWDYVRRETR